ncbi:Glucose-1-phosphate cytidylyltransferase [compost metagenome]
MLTYGDGVSNVNIAALEDFHRSHGKLATITTINVGQRFGVLDIGEDNSIHAFREKSDSDGSMINAGFMVLNPEVFDYIKDDSTVFEQEPLENMSRNGQVMAYKHEGFWQCMDTQRDKKKLEELWLNNQAPWRIWE